MFRKLLLSRIFIVPTTTTSFSYRYLSVTPSTVLKTEDLSHPSHRRAKIYNLKLGQLMKYYNDLNQNEKSLKLFDSTLAKGIKPDSHIYSLALLTCANLKNLDKGKWLHKLVESSSEIDIIENNIIKISLMKMYSQCGQMKECENIFFEQIRQHDIHTYTGMMQCYDYNQMAEKIIILFEKMRRNDQHIQPSVTLYMLILRACAKLRNLEKGKEIHELVTQKSMMKSQILSIIIDMYSQCFDVKSAEILFQTQTKYSVYTYNSMMKCYNLNQMPQRTLELYAKMKFKKKQEEIEMNVQTFINVLQACSMIAHVCLEDGQAVHAELLYKYKNLTKSIELQIALIQFYGHSGDVQSAKKIFDQLGKGRRTIEIWNALLNSYAINARTNEVLKLFKQMKQDGFIPQSQTYSIVLYSYGQLKMIEEAKILFESIEEKNNYIYGTMIDTLVRNKRYDEAQLLIEQYEKENVSNPILYLIVLDAAKNDGNVIEISKITEKLKQFENKIDLQYYTSSHVKLGNAYTVQGQYEQANHIYSMITSREYVDISDISWVNINGIIHSLYSNDKQHRNIDEIDEELNKLDKQLDGRLNLSKHSELLALALALKKTTSTRPIRITKSLQICQNCHSIIKQISHLCQRHIIIKDALQFHHFKTRDSSYNSQS